MNGIDINGIGMTSMRTRARLVNRLREKGIKNDSVLGVIMSTPRHLFVDEALANRAYEDTVLPIGFNQTLSQPYIVARMTEALLASEKPLTRVLEVGTGSGYQTSILAQLVTQVFSVERILPLQEQARKRIQSLGFRNVKMKHTDGSMGWAQKAPFDGIIVTAAPTSIPTELLEQLSSSGSMIIPVGPDQNQKLILIKRNGNGYTQTVLEPVHFVPLLGGALQ